GVGASIGAPPRGGGGLVSIVADPANSSPDATSGSGFGVGWGAAASSLRFGRRNAASSRCAISARFWSAGEANLASPPEPEAGGAGDTGRRRGSRRTGRDVGSKFSGSDEGPARPNSSASPESGSWRGRRSRKGTGCGGAGD